MPLRRSHRKTRSGCTQCKRRHIKCDEGRPRCDNCRDNNLTCEYHFASQKNIFTAPESTSTQSYDLAFLTQSYDLALQGNHQPLHLLTIDTSPTFDLSDLELMHHWSSDEAIIHYHNVLKTAAVRVGLTTPFVLHGILALSALHLCHLNPDRRNLYLFKSASHQNLALQTFRTALQNINSNNCEAIATLSILLPVLSYGDQWVGQIDNRDYIDSMVISMELVRGAATILRSWKDIILVGDLAPIFGSPVFGFLPTGELPELIALRDFLNELPGKLDIEAAKACAEAAGALHRLFAVHDNAIRKGISGVTVALAWPRELSVYYMHLLRKRKPCALVVLAYYTVLLHQYDSFWMIQGWTSKVLSSINSLLNGGIWESWMKWPMQIIATGLSHYA